MSDIKKVLCSKCRVAPERGFERDGETWAACPVCGQEDPVETILREAAQHHARKVIGDVLRGAPTGPNVTVNEVPQPESRWIIAD